MSHPQKSLTSFIKKHKIISSIIAIAIIDIIIVVISYFYLGIFTNHDVNLSVPNLQGKNIEEATEILRRNKLKIEVSDSIYLESVAPGCIIEQIPKAESMVKEGRLIYVTIRTFSTKLISMPELRDMSYRQGESLLKSSGIKSIRTEFAPSEFKDLILDTKWNGSTINKGDKIPANATITLVIGDGSLENLMEKQISEEWESSPQEENNYETGTEYFY